MPDEKEANTLYNKGAYGTPQPGGALVIDLAEALYLMENNRLAITGESARSLLHLAELFRLADKARVLHDPDLAASRMSKLLAVHGLA